MLKTISDIITPIKETSRLISAQVAHHECAKNSGLIIDVREPNEHVTTPSKGTINIPRGLLEMKMLTMEKDPSRSIYIHCATGIRAILAAEQLKRVGYENVSVITCPISVIEKIDFNLV